jgi:hypothetical protein
MRFWFARLAGMSANQMLMVAVAWHMYDITSSAWDLGLVGLFQFVPALVLMLFGAVGSVVLGGVGTVLIAAAWFKLFPALARRDRMEPALGFEGGMVTTGKTFKDSDNITQEIACWMLN